MQIWNMNDIKIIDYVNLSMLYVVETILCAFHYAPLCKATSIQKQFMCFIAGVISTLPLEHMASYRICFINDRNHLVRSATKGGATK